MTYRNEEGETLTKVYVNPFTTKKPRMLTDIPVRGIRNQEDNND